MDLSASEMKSVPVIFSDKVASDFKADFPPILRELNASVSSLDELIRFNEDHRVESMPPGEYGQDHLIRAAKAPVRTSDEYKSTAATLNELIRRRGLDHVFSTHDIDVLVLSLEVGYPALWSASAGYPSVISLSSWLSRPTELTAGDRTSWLLQEWSAFRLDVRCSPLGRGCAAQRHVGDS